MAIRRKIHRGEERGFIIRHTLESCCFIRCLGYKKNFHRWLVPLHGSVTHVNSLSASSLVSVENPPLSTAQPGVILFLPSLQFKRFDRYRAPYVTTGPLMMIRCRVGCKSSGGLFLFLLCVTPLPFFDSLSWVFRR